MTHEEMVAEAKKLSRRVPSAEPLVLRNLQAFEVLKKTFGYKKSYDGNPENHFLNVTGQLTGFHYTVWRSVVFWVPEYTDSMPLTERYKAAFCSRMQSESVAYLNFVYLLTLGLYITKDENTFLQNAVPNFRYSEYQTEFYDRLSELRIALIL